MKTSTSLFVAFSFILSLVYSEAWAQSTFQISYGTSGNESGNTVFPASDGGFLISGTAGTDILFLKTDALGNIQLQKQCGGAGNDYGNSVTETNDGGYLILSRTNSFGAGNDDAMLIKLDALGNIQWAKTYGLSNYEQPRIIRTTKTGEIFIVGTTNSAGAGGTDIMILKLDEIGNILWQKAYGGNEGELPYQIDFTIDGGLILVGFRHDYVTQREVLLMKTDSMGAMQWAKVYRDGNWNIGQGIDENVRLGGRQVGTNEEFYVSGYTTSYGAGDEDIFIMKTDGSGNLVWSKTYGGTGMEISRGVMATASGLLVPGFTTSFGSGGGDVYLLQLDFNGNLLGSRTYGGANSDMVLTEATDNMLQFTDDGGIVLLSSTESFGAGGKDIYLVKAAINGSSGCNETDSTATQAGVAPFNVVSVTPTVTNLSLAVMGAAVAVNNIILQDSVLCRELPGNSCANAIEIPTDTNIENIIENSDIQWFRFTADVSEILISVSHPFDSLYYATEIALYSDCDTLLVKSDFIASDSANNRVLVIQEDSLIAGATYYLKITFNQLVLVPLNINLYLNLKHACTNCLLPIPVCEQVINGNFSAACHFVNTGCPSQFVTNDVCFWRHAWGTPQLLPQPPGTPDFAYMWANNTQGEAILTRVAVVAGRNYILSYRIRIPSATSPTVNNFFVVLAQAAASGLPFGGAGCGDPIPNPIPGAIQIINQQTNIVNANWVIIRLCFAANNNYNQLVFYPQQTGTAVASILIDNVSLIPVTVNAGPDRVITCGNDAQLNAISCTMGTVTWSPAAGLNNTIIFNPVASPTATTTYTVTFTSLNCQAQDNITVTVNPLNFTFTFSDILPCQGGSNGSIDMTVTGGASPLAYSWSNGAATQDLTNIPAGTYTVTITDAKGCTGTTSHTLTAVQVMKLILSSTNVTCNGACDGTISVQVKGGTPPYTYLTGGPTVSNLCPGVNIFLVADANGCMVSNFTTITELPTNISLFSSVTPARCFGESNGTIDLTVSGGTAPYTYAWAPPISSANNANEDQTNLPAGSYSVRVTDATGDCITDISIPVSQPAPISISFSALNPWCSGGSNGQVTAVASGGNGGYTYLWINPAGKTGQTVTGLTAGIYSVSVTDMKGCTGTGSYVLADPVPITLAFNVNGDCNGLPFDGSVDLTVSGSTLPNTYQWSNGATTEDVAMLLAGTYSVTVTDNKGCKRKSIVIVPSLSGPSVSVTVTDDPSADCNESVTAVISTGVSPFSFIWSNGQITLSASPLCSGTYSVTVTDGNGCTSVASITFTETPSLYISVLSGYNVSCYGGSDGYATVSASGGTPPYSYLWNDPGAQTTSTASGLIAGTYSVTVTDNSGSTATQSISILQPPPLSLIANKGPSCTTPPTGIIELDPSGGAKPYTFLWNNGATTGLVTGLAAGNYSVTLTDANGCSITESIDLTVDDFTCHIETSGGTWVNGPIYLCPGETIDLTAKPNGATYLWNTGSTNQTVNVPTGTYSVQIISLSGCTCAVSVIIEQTQCISGPDLCIDLVMVKSQVKFECQGLYPPPDPISGCICQGKTVGVGINNLGTAIASGINVCTLTVTIDFPSEVHYFGFDGWYYPGGIKLPLPQPTVIPTSTGIILTWTDLCDLGVPTMSGFSWISIFFNLPADIGCYQNPPPEISVDAEITPDDGGCSNSINKIYTYSGPLDPNEKVVSHPEGVGICHTVISSDTLTYQIYFQNVGTASATNVYILDTLDLNMDVSTIHNIHTDHPLTMFNIQPPGILEFYFIDINLPDSATDLLGSTGFIQFSILPVQNIAPATVITNRAAIFFDYNQPVITNTVFNTILDLPVTIAAGSSTLFCEGGSVILSAGTANGYLWSTGETTQSIAATTPGLYSVQDASACKAPSDTIDVTVNENPVVDIGSCVTVYYGYSPYSCDTIVASVTSGSLPFTYYWNTGEATTGIIVCPTATVNYSLTVTDANGCTGTDEITVEVVDIRCGINLDKVQICHYPPGNPQNTQDLCISENAVAAHLTNHSDILGLCGTVDPCASAKTASAPKGDYDNESESESALDKAFREVENRVTFEFVPNPVRDNAKIVFRIPEDAQVSVKFYTTAGKRIVEINGGSAEKNIFYLLFLEKFRLPDGIYLGVLSYGDKSYIKKVTVIKK